LDTHTGELRYKDGAGAPRRDSNVAGASDYMLQAAPCQRTKFGRGRPWTMSAMSNPAGESQSGSWEARKPTQQLCRVLKQVPTLALENTCAIVYFQFIQAATRLPARRAPKRRPVLPMGK